MPKPCVSVIIPVYNIIAFLEEAIQSVLTQDFDGIEIVVVNDGSLAEISGEIAEICVKDKRIRLIHQSNTGQSIARSNGVKHAVGDYIMFLDADDILLPGAIGYLVAALRNNPASIAAYGKKVITENDAFKHMNVLPGKEQSLSGDILPGLLEGMTILSNGSVCMRRDAISQVAFPDRRLPGEDWITWCRLSLLGDIICAGERPVLCIRLHSGSTSEKAIIKPAMLFSMLDVVYGDEQFIARMGKRKIIEYRMVHTRNLYVHFFVNYRDRGQHIRKWKYQLLWSLSDMSLHLFRARGEEIEKKKVRVREPVMVIPPKGGKIRVLHVVKWFYAGGAERLVSSLLKHSSDQFEHIVLSLSDQNERLGDISHTLGIPYKAIDIRRDGNNLVNYIHCILFIRRVNPDVMKTWLPPSNITGGIMGRLLGIPVIWGIHDASDQLIPNTRKQLSLSRFIPEQIICCSDAVYKTCKKVGYKQNLLKVILNGTDIDMFIPRPEGRKKIRTELNIGENTLLIGMAAEFIPIKRHKNFLVAAKILLSDYPDTQFLFCGRDTGNDSELLRKYIHILDLQTHVHLLGIRDDMADIYSALDIHTLNSECESFGLAVTEAMACKTLCVATDVGIMKELLDEVGEIIPISDDPHVLAEAWKKLLRLADKEKSERLQRGRDRIIQHYSIVETARKYDDVLRQAVL